MTLRVRQVKQVSRNKYADVLDKFNFCWFRTHTRERDRQTDRQTETVCVFVRACVH